MCVEPLITNGYPQDFELWGILLVQYFEAK